MHDRLALASLITFCLGAVVGRIGDKIGAKTRLWLMLGTFLQALMSMAAAIAIRKSGEPSFEGVNGAPAWTTPAAFVGVGFMSASFGLQGIMAKRLNTSFTTTRKFCGFFPQSTMANRAG
jgi:MFS family permease